MQVMYKEKRAAFVYAETALECYVMNYEDFLGSRGRSVFRGVRVEGVVGMRRSIRVEGI